MPEYGDINVCGFPFTSELSVNLDLFSSCSNNVGTRPGRILTAVVPCGFERFIREWSHPVKDPMEPPPARLRYLHSAVLVFPMAIGCFTDVMPRANRACTGSPSASFKILIFCSSINRLRFISFCPSSSRRTLLLLRPVFRGQVSHVLGFKQSAFPFAFLTMYHDISP
jgi:hypothetical protein